LIVKYPRAALASVAVALGLVGLLWVLKPYGVVVPVNPFGLGSLQWWNWWIYN